MVNTDIDWHLQTSKHLVEHYVHKSEREQQSGQDDQAACLQFQRKTKELVTSFIFLPILSEVSMFRTWFSCHKQVIE